MYTPNNCTVLHNTLFIGICEHWWVQKGKDDLADISAIFFLYAEDFLDLPRKKQKKLVYFSLGTHQAKRIANCGSWEISVSCPGSTPNNTAVEVSYRQAYSMALQNLEQTAKPLCLTRWFYLWKLLISFLNFTQCWMHNFFPEILNAKSARSSSLLARFLVRVFWQTSKQQRKF